VFTGQQRCNFVDALFEDLAKSKEDSSSAERRLRRPCGECSSRSSDGCIDFGRSSQRDLGLYLSVGGVVHVSKSAGVSGQRLTIDPVVDFAEFLLRGKGRG
jgi:hypothetical protein